MNIRILSIIFVSLLVGFSGGYFYLANTSQQSGRVLGECESSYFYVNPRLGCQSKPIIKKHEYTALQQDITNYISEETNVKHVDHVSVYFRDLIAGPTFGIESQDVFAPASLLKLPLLMTYLNLADEDPSLLDKEASYTKVIAGVKQETDSIPQLEPNKKYKISDLLSRMIVYSDNVSYWLLLDYLAKMYPGEDRFTKTLKELGLINPRTAIENTITVKAYASLFRQLYNSSYMSSAHSEKALELLSQSTYTDGLNAGLPSGMKVAHKFGELEGLPNAERQLHDCGIIYYPNNPYLLCVMTRGDNFDEQVNVIKTISEKVYKEVDSRKY